MTGIFKLINDGEISPEDGRELRELLFLPGGIELHVGMFVPTIQSQATKEQMAKWLPDCASLRMIGTYAQTELGHGTYIRGLETVAVYDPDTDEFVVHTPTLSATKWWPGGLGRTVNTVVLMARLFTKGEDRGMHAFVVPIRDYDTHLPLPGIEVGDIGPKLGFNGVDNGFLRFDHVRVPRFNLLSRFARVERDGTYVPPPAKNNRASYGTMVFVRATIVADSGNYLGRAVTIATRYALVRRQTATELGQKELQVLDYDNVAQTLLPLAARSYGLRFAGKLMMKAYSKFDEDRAHGAFDTLPDLHGTSSGLKAASSNMAAAGIEAARRCCGGHGYSALSGLPNLFASYVQNVTWEGDNNVMFLQLARYLIKKRLAALDGSAPASKVSQQEADSNFAEPWGTAYIAFRHGPGKSDVRGVECWSKPENVLAALRHVSRRQTDAAVRVLTEAGNGKLTFSGAAWNSTTVDLIRAARAHTSAVLHAGFAKYVEDATITGRLSPPAVAALRRVLALHGVTLLLDHEADLLHDGYVSDTQIDALHTAARSFTVALRPDAMAIVDGLGHEDYQLNSALGRKDGDVYRSLLETAKLSPLNATPEGPGWEKVLKPARKELSTGLIAELAKMAAKM